MWTFVGIVFTVFLFACFVRALTSGKPKSSGKPYYETKEWQNLVYRQKLDGERINRRERKKFGFK